MTAIVERKRPRQAQIKVDTPRLSGYVKWFDPTKGYGFIERSGAPDVFIHIRNLPDGVDDLAPGLAVTFQTIDSGRGLRAVNILWSQADVA